MDAGLGQEQRPVTWTQLVVLKPEEKGLVVAERGHPALQLLEDGVGAETDLEPFHLVSPPRVVFEYGAKKLMVLGSPNSPIWR